MRVVSVSRFWWTPGSDGRRTYNDEPDHALLLQRDTSATTRSQWKEPVWSVSWSTMVGLSSRYRQDLPQAALSVLFLLTSDVWVFRLAVATRCTIKVKFGSELPNLTSIGSEVEVYGPQN